MGMRYGNGNDVFRIWSTGFHMGMNMNTKRFIDKYFIPCYCFVIYMQFYCLLISQYFMANIFLIPFIEYRNIFIRFILIETPDCSVGGDRYL